MPDTQVVVITGASRGIGFATARRFAADGATVIGTSRTAEGAARIEAAAEGLAGTIHGVVLDLGDGDGAGAGDQEFAEAVRARTEHVDVLVCNAGVLVEADDIAEQTVADFRTVLDINLVGPFRTVRALLPLLQAAEAPRVVTLHGGLGNISSGMEGGGCVAYRASKAGVAALTMTLAQEGADDGLLACGYDPGWVATDLGGDDAPRQPDECGAEIVALAARMRADKLTGALVRDGSPVAW
jgi:NAD(P)-dependent dehydrogenase (short-subunit alcohol dehydrogenase family)